MSLIGAIRWTALRTLSANQRVFRHSQQLQSNESIRLTNIFRDLSLKVTNSAPERPKRPQSGYNMFYKDISAQLRAQNPNLKVKDVAKAVAEEWQQLDLNDKQVLVEKGRKGSEDYKQEIEKWKNSLSDKQREQYLTELRTRRRVLARRRLKVELKRLEYPIRPKSAFNLYIKEAIERRERTDQPYTQVFKHIVSKWSSLTPEEKEPYIETAKIDKLRYLEEMEEWKERVSKSDNRQALDRLNKLKTQSSKSSLTSGLKDLQKNKIKRPKAKKAMSLTTKSKTKAKPKSLKSKSKTKKVAKSKSKKILNELKLKKSKTEKKRSKEKSESSDESEK